MCAPEVALGVHHAPHGLSARIARGFSKVLRFCADEAHHRDVNHGFASERGGGQSGPVSPYPDHAAELRPDT
jgi:hypothetical protein